MIVSDCLAGVVASAIAGLRGLRIRGGRLFCGSATVKDRELTMVSRVVTAVWQETLKRAVGVFSMLPGGELRQVPAVDGANRIVAYRRFSGDSLWAVIDRVAARRLRECPS